jgi:hypothetical protein
VRDGAQSVLQRMNRRCLEPIHLGPQYGQFSRLRQVIERSAMPELCALLKAEIVHVPARANPLDDRRVFDGCRFSEINVGALNQHLRLATCVVTALG